MRLKIRLTTYIFAVSGQIDKTLADVTDKNGFSHLVVTPPFPVPFRSVSANLTYKARTQVDTHLACYIFDNTHAPTNASPPLCYAKPFGTDPASRYYFLLFFSSILVLSFCYNGIFLMGGFPFPRIVLPSSCHSAAVVLIS